MGTTGEFYCAHCALLIRYLGDWVNGWVHISSKSIWCGARYDGPRARP